MRATKPVLAACVAIAVGYMASPYIALYRLGTAIHAGDARTLAQLVNWPSVRQGIKQDIASQLQPQGDTLPGFGASFVRGIAAHAVDQRVTPQGLVAAVHHAAAPAAHGADVHVGWAFFEGPTQFLVSLRAPGQAQPIRLQLELRDASWQVTRVWLPPALLDEANQRT